MKQDYYTSCIGLTTQFRFCPNSFRVDMYKGCDFGCSYCFSNNKQVNNAQGFKIANIKTIENLFYNAFETDKKDNLTIELLRHKVPLHCGGMSDPFQTREFEYHLTKRLIELSNKYNYPIQFCSKTASLPDDYLEIINPEIHAFQTSILGWSEEFVRKFEGRTPTAQDRLKFGEMLRNKGFWWSIRIQPLIDINEALLLIDNAKSIPSYYTIEHLKMPFYNDKAFSKMLMWRGLGKRG